MDWPGGGDHAEPLETLGNEVAQSQEFRELLHQMHRARAGAVDVEREGSPGQDAWKDPVHQVPPHVGSRPIASAVPPADQALPPIPEHEETGELPPRMPFTRMPPAPEEPPMSRINSESTVPEPLEAPTGEIASEGDNPPQTPQPLEPVSKRPRQGPSPTPPSFQPPQITPGELQGGHDGRVLRQADEFQQRERYQRAEQAMWDVVRRSGNPSAARGPRGTEDGPGTSSSSTARPGRSRSPPGEPDTLLQEGKVWFSFTTSMSGDPEVVLLAGKDAEVKIEDLDDNELAAFHGSDKQEWEAILKTKAVVVIPPDKAAEVRTQRPDWIIGSRMVRRRKPMPGIGNFKAKSRWCCQGQQDPDTGLLRTFAPTPQTESINLFFQVAVNLGFQVHFADVRNAFCQAKKLKRARGKIYVEPCEGVPVPPGSLIELVAPVYGLDDAPLLWHETLIEFFQSQGYRRSLLEPCWLVKHEDNKCVGQALIEVDDINLAAKAPELEQTLPEGRS